MFSIGDIIYGRVTRKSGCSVNHRFAIVTKITPTKRFGVTYIGQIKHEPSYSDMHVIKSRTEPDINKKLGTGIISSEGIEKSSYSYCQFNIRFGIFY